MSRGSKFRVEWAPYAVEYLGTNKLPSVVTIDGEVGSGGEAVIYSVHEIPNALIKLYRTNDPRELLFREEKVRAMIKAKPQEPTPGHITFAWPLGMVYDKQGRFRGFVMPYIRCAVPISNFFYLDDYSWMDKFRSCGVPEDRLNWIRNNIELFRVGVALNLVKAVGYLHAVGHFVGDLNDKNVLVNSHGLVTLIDADSFFIRDPDTGQTYPSEVGVGEYTAPEVLRGLIPPDRRSEGTDVFSLSVIIFKLLMNGYHPFAGTVPSRESNTIEDNIRDCLSPYFGKGRRKVRKPIGAPDINSLSPELINLFERVFQSCDGSGRPSIEEFLRILENYYHIIRQGMYKLDIKRQPIALPLSSRHPSFPVSPHFSRLSRKKQQPSSASRRIAESVKRKLTNEENLSKTELINLIIAIFVSLFLTIFLIANAFRIFVIITLIISVFLMTSYITSDEPGGKWYYIVFLIIGAIASIILAITNPIANYVNYVNNSLWSTILSLLFIYYFIFSTSIYGILIYLIILITLEYIKKLLNNIIINKRANK